MPKQSRGKPEFHWSHKPGNRSSKFANQRPKYRPPPVCKKAPPRSRPATSGTVPTSPQPTFFGILSIPAGQLSNGLPTNGITTFSNGGAGWIWLAQLVVSATETFELEIAYDEATQTAVVSTQLDNGQSPPPTWIAPPEQMRLTGKFMSYPLTLPAFNAPALVDLTLTTLNS